jgi:Tol biopolymer transport system component
MRPNVNVTITFAALLTIGQLFAQTDRSVNTAFKAAQHREQVEGDLKGAIEQYKRLAENGDRAIAAQALVRMAECYQKLGEAEAGKLYERVLREYADQKEPVALARVRLGRTGSANAEKVDRAVWPGPVNPSTSVSPDGRFIVYVGNFGQLMLHDITADTDRALTPVTRNETAGPSAISRDGKYIAYEWRNSGGNEVRLARMEENGFLRPRVLTETYLLPYDFSPDGKWIVASIGNQQTGMVDLGLLAVADGSFKVLETHRVDTIRHRLTRQFSPDGKYIAYDRPASDTDLKRDVYVISADGSRNIPAVVHTADDELMGWSPDGSRLLFSSDRTGSVGLWALPFADGKVQGPPELLKYIGPSFALGGVTNTGTMYVHKTFNTRDLAIAPIDLEAGKLLGPPVPFAQGYVENAANPSWSADGRYLAYQACDNFCIVIRSVATGEARRLPPKLYFYRAPVWAPDGHSLLVRGDLSGKSGIFQIDSQTGEAKALILSEGLNLLAAWSPDGRKLYFNRNRVFIERDIASGTERDVYSGPGNPYGRLSPDGKYFAIAGVDEPEKAAYVLVVPVAGDAPREILRLSPSETLFGGTMWTPDSSSLIIQKNTGSRWEMWRIPIAGGQPRKLDIDPGMWRNETVSGGSVIGGDVGFTLSQDGHKVVLTIGKNVSEVWALENFLPATKTRR